MLGEPDQWSRGASQSRGALLFCTDKFSGVNRRLLLALALAAVCPLSGAGQRADTTPVPAALSDFFKPGVVLQDRNGDGAIDFVDARIVLAKEPSSGELAAGADIAARLGFETSAMNLPMGGTGVPIFIGTRALTEAGVRADAVGGTGLRAGDGCVSTFTVEGRPAI